MPNRLFGLPLRPAPADSADFDSADRRSEIAHSAESEFVENLAREAGLDTFPNDLTRMLYLASLRDCNSGRYLHPQLSPKMGTEAADRGLCACHNQVFRGLLKTPISGYVVQMEEYIRYTREARDIVLKTWQSLKAYRATVPVLALPIYSELFCLNVEVALAILKDERPSVNTHIQEAASR
jgi:hypothetical protein